MTAIYWSADIVEMGAGVAQWECAAMDVMRLRDDLSVSFSSSLIENGLQQQMKSLFVKVGPTAAPGRIRCLVDLALQSTSEASLYRMRRSLRSAVQAESTRTMLLRAVTATTQAYLTAAVHYSEVNNTLLLFNSSKAGEPPTSRRIVAYCIPLGVTFVVLLVSFSVALVLQCNSNAHKPAIRD